MIISGYFLDTDDAGLRGFIIYKIQQDSISYSKIKPHHPRHLRLNISQL